MAGNGGESQFLHGFWRDLALDVDGIADEKRAAKIASAEEIQKLLPSDIIRAGHFIQLCGERIGALGGNYLRYFGIAKDFQIFALRVGCEFAECHRAAGGATEFVGEIVFRLIGGPALELADGLPKG